MRPARSIACRVLRLDDAMVVDGAGDEMTWSLKAYRRGAGEPDGPLFDEERQVFSASGTASLWRRDVFEVLGGFDEDFFAYYEDVDLGFRARLADYECWYAPQARLGHIGGASRHLGPRGVDGALAVRNRWATAIKNAPRSWLVGKAPWIVAGEALWLARSTRERALSEHLAAYRRLARERRLWARKRQTASRAEAAQTLVRRQLPPQPPLLRGARR